MSYKPQVPWSPPFEYEYRNGDQGPVPASVTKWRPQEMAFSYDWMGNTTYVGDDEKLIFDRSPGHVTNGNSSGEGPHQLRTTDGLEAHYDAAGNLIDLTVQRQGRCLLHFCAQRFVYDWDEVGHLMRARRWDYVGNTIPTDAPKWPDAPNETPTRDLTFLYSEGERIVRRSTDETRATVYDLAIFDTLGLTDVRPKSNSEDYVFNPSSVRLRLADFARVVYAPSLPRAPGSTSGDYRVFLELKDDLGSSSITLNRETSEVVERISHLPYGGIENYFRPDRWILAQQRPIRARYSGKAVDAEVGLINFGARYLHTHLGRWISPDPLVQIKAIEDINPYQFVSGRLFATTDPNGLLDEKSGKRETPENDVWIDPKDGTIYFPDQPIKGHVPDRTTTVPEVGVEARPEMRVEARDNTRDTTNLTGLFFFAGIMKHSGSLSFEQLGLAGFDEQKGFYVASLSGVGGSSGAFELVRADERLYYFRTGESEREQLGLFDAQLFSSGRSDFGVGAFMSRTHPISNGIYFYEGFGGFVYGGGGSFDEDFNASAREVLRQNGVKLVSAPPGRPRPPPPQA